jgi:hypothetical protein
MLELVVVVPGVTTAETAVGAAGVIGDGFGGGDGTSDDAQVSAWIV